MDAAQGALDPSKLDFASMLGRKKPLTLRQAFEDKEPVVTPTISETLLAPSPTPPAQPDDVPLTHKLKKKKVLVRGPPKRNNNSEGKGVPPHGSPKTSDDPSHHSHAPAPPTLAKDKGKAVLTEPSSRTKATAPSSKSCLVEEKAVRYRVTYCDPPYTLPGGVEIRPDSNWDNPEDLFSVMKPLMLRKVGEPVEQLDDTADQMSYVYKKHLEAMTAAFILARQSVKAQKASSLVEKENAQLTKKLQEAEAEKKRLASDHAHVLRTNHQLSQDNKHALAERDAAVSERDKVRRESEEGLKRADFAEAELRAARSSLAMAEKQAKCYKEEAASICAEAKAKVAAQVQEGIEEFMESPALDKFLWGEVSRIMKDFVDSSRDRMPGLDAIFEEYKAKRFPPS